MMPQPNVIIILADDLGYGDLGIYGNPDLKTPHLDRLAHEGIRFTQHYSGSPLCAPARASLLTGRYNHRTGALSVESNRGLDRISLRETTIADIFKNAGYATGMVGKWHNGLHDMQYHPNNRGFNEFCGFLNGGMDYWNWIIEYNGQPERSDGRYLTDVFTDEANKFIKRHAQEPFFLYLAYNAPHSPLQATLEDIQPYLDSGKYNRAVSTLYGMIQRMDAGIGYILDTLEKQNLADNTIVLFTSDNGPWLGNDKIDDEIYSMMRFNGPFRGMKQDVLEGGIRVPAILRWNEGLPHNSECHDMIHFTDWLPTLASACEIAFEAQFALDGLNQLAVLQGETSTNSTPRFWQFNRYDPVPYCNVAMRDDNWKLYYPRIPEAMAKLQIDNSDYHENFTRPHLLKTVENPVVERSLSPPQLPELYDLDKDPYESRNIADQYPGKVNAMKHAIENWFIDVNQREKSG